jgi:hypothetical protein
MIVPLCIEDDSKLQCPYNLYVRTSSVLRLAEEMFISILFFLSRIHSTCDRILVCNTDINMKFLYLPIYFRLTRHLCATRSRTAFSLTRLRGDTFFDINTQIKSARMIYILNRLMMCQLNQPHIHPTILKSILILTMNI